MGKPRETLAKALVVTAEVMGHELSPIAAEAMARELANYPPAAVADALRRCQRELSCRLTLAAVLERISDGHPGVEEAWAIAVRMADEGPTVVLTDDIGEAYAVASPLLAQRDHVAARMAFRECYTRLLKEARAERRQPRWTVAYGADRDGEPAVAAAEKGLLSASYARQFVNPERPGFERLENRLRALEGRPALPPPCAGGGALTSGEIRELTAGIGRSFKA